MLPLRMGSSDAAVLSGASSSGPDRCRRCSASADPNRSLPQRQSDLFNLRGCSSTLCRVCSLLSLTHRQVLACSHDLPALVHQLCCLAAAPAAGAGGGKTTVTVGPEGLIFEPKVVDVFESFDDMSLKEELLRGISCE